MFRTSDKIDIIAGALVDAQITLGVASETSTNPHFKSSYADLTEVVKASRPSLTKNGIAVIQGGHKLQDGEWILTTRLLHKSGQWIESDFPLVYTQKTSQALGSATSYAKRYSQCAMTGVVTGDDDDGNASSAPNPQTPLLKQAVKSTGKPLQPVQTQTYGDRSRPATQAQIRMIGAKLNDLGITQDGHMTFIQSVTGKNSVAQLFMSDIDKVIQAIEDEKSKPKGDFTNETTFQEDIPF